MKKIIIIGCPGSGKSYFARKLKEKLHYPLHYLDCLFWQENWTHLSTDELRKKINKIMLNDTWIIDGNYTITLQERFIYADTIFIFDLDVEVCLESEANRRGKAREDFPSYLVETEDPTFTAYIKNFKKEQTPYIYQLVSLYPNKEYHIFKTRKQADDFIDNLNL